MDREGEHASAQFGNDRVLLLNLESAQVYQQLFGMSQGCLGGSLQPTKLLEVVNSRRLQGEDDFREIEPLYFRQILGGALGVFGLRPEPHASSGRRTPGAAGALVSACAADPLHKQ